MHPLPPHDLVKGAIEAVIAAGSFASRRGWIPATSGNFSVRVDAGHVALTRSGADKGALSQEDVLIQPLRESLLPNSSAEALLHLDIYEDDPLVGAVFHIHSRAAALISRAHLEAGFVRLTGWELQKAFAGVRTHEAAIDIPIFVNDQNIPELAVRIAEHRAMSRNSNRLTSPGYLISSHGLYAWGQNSREAMRHLEAFDALLELLLLEGAYRP